LCLRDIQSPLEQTRRHLKVCGLPQATPCCRADHCSASSSCRWVLAWSLQMNKWNHALWGLLCHLFLVMSVRLIHITVCPFFPWHCWAAAFVWLHHNLLIHIPVSGQGGCSSFSAIVDEVDRCNPFPEIYVLGGELPGSTVAMPTHGFPLHADFRPGMSVLYP
jgi:hypothetical protein